MDEVSTFFGKRNTQNKDKNPIRKNYSLTKMNHSNNFEQSNLEGNNSEKEKLEGNNSEKEKPNWDSKIAESTEHRVYKRFDKGKNWPDKTNERYTGERYNKEEHIEVHDKKEHNKKEHNKEKQENDYEESNHIESQNSENNQKPTRWVPKRIDLTTEEGQRTLCIKNAKGCLNKMTQQTFDKLSEQYLDIAMRDIRGTEKEMILPGLLKSLIDQIFEQALLQPEFCSLYSNLCVKINKAMPMFRKELLGKCQEEFERDARVPSSDYTDEEKNEFLFLAKKRTLGNIKFIAELYKNKILVVPIMHVCVKRLLKQTPTNPDEEQLELLCKLLFDIGILIDTENAKNVMDGYFNEIVGIIAGGKVTTRIRFMLEDVQTIRNNKWIQ